MSQDFDLLIVGGGVVGCTLALALADAPLRIGLVESAAFPCGRARDSAASPRGRARDDTASPRGRARDSAASPRGRARGGAASPQGRAVPGAPGVTGFDLRVNTLNLQAQRLLQRLSVWEALDAERACPFVSMEVWDAEGSGCIRFAAAEAGEEVLGWTVEQRLLRAALRERLEECPAVRICDGVAVRALEHSNGRPRLILEDGAELCAELVVAADGGRSRMREFAGFAARERDCGQRAIVAAVETEHAHGGAARQTFLPTGPLAFLPLRDGAEERDGKAGRYCSIVWSADLHEAERLQALPDADFAAELERAFERRLGAVRAVGARASFPLRQLHARAYFRDAVVLLGDAAHVIHPLAGQGLNLGLRDAAALAEELLAQLACGGALAAEPVLRRYQRRRRLRNAAMLASMRGFQTLFGAGHPAFRLLRNLGIDAADRLPPLKRLLMSEAMGLLPD